ncbi:MAG TPA: hypothetical protein VGC53_05365 [Vicinamibacteria bacterium]|jgi:hypothetical protein
MRKGAGLFLQVILVGLVSCAWAPERELKEATQVLDQARAVEADLYASETFQEAADILTMAQAELEAQAEKSILSRSYGEAAKLLESAKLAGSRAVYEAKSGKEQARQDAEAAIRDARAALESSQASLAKARSSKQTSDDLQSMKADLETLQAVLAEAEIEFEAGNFIDARNKAEMVLAEAGSIGQGVGNASKKTT